MACHYQYQKNLYWHHKILLLNLSAYFFQLAAKNGVFDSPNSLTEIDCQAFYALILSKKQL